MNRTLALLLFVAAPAGAASQWTAIGPSGGPMSNLVAAPSAPSVLYASASDIYRSGDGGASWKQVRARAHVIAVDPLRPNRIFSDTEIISSRDGGATWSAREYGFRNALVTAIAFLPHQPQSLLAATNEGLFRSDDDARSWRPAGLPGSLTELVTSRTDSRLWFAIEAFDASPGSESSRLWRTIDAGSTWTSAATGTAPYELASLSVDGSDPSRMYVLSGGRGILASRDSGATFDLLPASPLGTVLTTGHDGTLYLVGAFPGRQREQVLASRDHGVSWTPLSENGGGPVDDLSRLLVGNPHVLLATGQRGIWKSIDGGRTWKGSSFGIFALFASSISTSSDGARIYLGAGSEGVFVGDGSALGWQRARTGLPAASNDPHMYHLVRADPFFAERAFDYTPSGVFRTDDAGGRWQRLPGPATFALQYVNDLAVDGAFADRVALAGPGVVLSEDGGATWQSAYPYYVDDFAFDGGNRDQFYAATLTGLMRSTDHGHRWKRIGAGLPASGFVRRVWSMPGEAGVLFASTGPGGLWISSDGGDTFLQAIHGESGRNFEVFDLVRDLENSNRVFLLGWRTRGNEARREIWVLSRSDHTVTPLSDAASPQPSAIAARPGAPGELFAAGPSVFRIDFEL